LAVVKVPMLGGSGCVAVIAALGLWLVACGGSGAGTFTALTANTLTVATAEIPEPGLWMGTEAHPTGGFEYEMARALASRLGLAKVKVVVRPFKALTTGQLHGVDVAISDITATPARAQYVSFSTPYLPAPPAVVVRPGTGVSDVYAARQLRWAVQEGTTLQSALESAIRPSTPPLVLHHQREALAALRAGRVEAVMLDLPVALSLAREAPAGYAVAAQLPSEDRLAVALPKGSENVEAVDSALRALSSDGTIEQLGRTWLHIELDEGQAEQVPVLRTGEE
jgi:polar amino acid transport system substrate-binding protein